MGERRCAVHCPFGSVSTAPSLQPTFNAGQRAFLQSHPPPATFLLHCPGQALDPAMNYVHHGHVRCSSCASFAYLSPSRLFIGFFYTLLELTLPPQRLVELKPSHSSSAAIGALGEAWSLWLPLSLTCSILALKSPGAKP